MEEQELDDDDDDDDDIDLRPRLWLATSRGVYGTS